MEYIIVRDANCDVRANIACTVGPATTFIKAVECELPRGWTAETARLAHLSAFIRWRDENRLGHAK